MANDENDLSSVEEKYFKRKNKELMEKLAAKKKEKPRPSPVTGEAMIPEIMFGVVIDRCPTSRGIWLDAGELEMLMAAGIKEHDERSNWVKRLFKRK
ncbi:MAG: zf-TFIIB domain-containing protein [Deltaproteobacteria bacterium]|nr:zf-TFIIB domain-containing protein [Deltaproteobacteria bacterium]